MRLLATIALFTLTAALQAYENRNLLEATGGTSSSGKPPKVPTVKRTAPTIPGLNTGDPEEPRKEIPPGGLKGSKWIDTHLMPHHKKAFEKIGDGKRQSVDKTGGVSPPGGRKKTQLSDPRRYESPKMIVLRHEKHGLTSSGQLANPTRHGITRLASPRRYESESLTQLRREHHSGRKM